MQGQPACRAGEPSGQGEEPPPEGPGGGYPLSQTDPRRPAGQVVGHRLDGQPGAVGGEAARGEMVQPDAVLEVSDGILDLGVAAMVSLQFEQLPVPVGDEAELIEARDERRLLNLQRRLARVKLLIIDELGFVPLSKAGAELLFEVFSQRYERAGSVLVTSNLPFDEWTEVFGSERLTGALLDRLTHHVDILEMNGDWASCRCPGRG